VSPAAQAAAAAKSTLGDAKLQADIRLKAELEKLENQNAQEQE
jgi:hypothetical protein